MYRFIVLYVCIYVAPWTREARHFIPLYVPTCSGMTIKLNLNLIFFPHSPVSYRDDFLHKSSDIKTAFQESFQMCHTILLTLLWGTLLIHIIYYGNDFNNLKKHHLITHNNRKQKNHLAFKEPTSLVKKIYTKMYLKYIYFVLSILQIHLHIYVLNKIPCNCTFSGEIWKCVSAPIQPDRAWEVKRWGEE